MPKELKHQVTEAEYAEALTKGWDDEDMLKPGTYKVRRARHTTKAISKEKISINLDTDILDYFRSNAQKTSIPYQVQINQVLRQAVKTKEESLPENLEKLLDDEKFLKKLKKRLAAV